MWRSKPSCSSIHVDVCMRSSRTTLVQSRSFCTTRLQKSSTPSISNQELRTIFEQYVKQNNVSPTDWYKLSLESLDENTQKIISKEFKGSFYRALSKIFPETEWKPWKFQNHQVPKRFWKEQSNQRKFFDDLGHQIGIQTLDDWYEKLSLKQILSNGGRGLLSHSDNSPTAALMAAYPEHNWIPWRFNVISIGYWKDVKNQRKFFDDLGKNLGVEKMDDWYSKLSHEAILKHGGSSLLGRNMQSPQVALMAAYPEHNWIPWKFNNVPRKFWRDKSNQRKFFDDLGKQLGVQTLDDWYPKITYDIVVEKGGGSMISLYNGSACNALMAAYPEHNWIPWKFTVAPTGFWNSKDNVKQYLNELSEKLSIQTLDDWYRVDYVQLKQFGASGMLRKYKSMYDLLKEQYPHHPWDARRFNQTGKKAQRWLAVTLKRMFPDEEILEDYQHPKAFLSSKRPMQLDVYIPSKSLAFEYQGKQHYEEVGVFNPTRIYQRRDEEKRTLCAANNIKLIEVPYWWNRTQQELQEMMDAGFAKAK